MLEHLWKKSFSRTGISGRRYRLYRLPVRTIFLQKTPSWYLYSGLGLWEDVRRLESVSQQFSLIGRSELPAIVEVS